ncbi:MAG TPA: DEAD/DEAH box helicase, partial [Sorangium sp.]|nr:DEAD/DEAH box helicase [Sorangium sp.]
MPFDALGLIPDLVRAVKHAGYEQPTPIQRDAIPPVLQGRDVVGCAQTGTGKTAAFTLPLLQHLDERADRDGVVLRALVLT